MSAFPIVLMILARVSYAQFAFTAPISSSVVVAGSPFAITWTTNNVTSLVSLLLLQGSSSDLTTAATIATGAVNSGTYSWTPDSSLVPGTDYTIEIGIGDSADASTLVNTTYSSRFTVAGGPITSAVVQNSSSSQVASGTETYAAASTSSFGDASNASTTISTSIAVSTDTNNVTFVSTTSSKETSTSSIGASTQTQAASLSATGLVVTASTTVQYTTITDFAVQSTTGAATASSSVNFAARAISTNTYRQSMWVALVLALSSL